MVPLFAATLFLSAGLLFWIQPLFAKMALPLLGGAPAVWNTAMMFFQGMLLLAYGYVHVVTAKLGIRLQTTLQLIILITAFAFLPVAVRGSFTPGEQPVWALLGLLGLSIGVPFFAVSTTAPLLQRWFSLTGHRNAADPYFLYVASNLGSVAALLSFPLFLEPRLTLTGQGVAWAGGFAVLLVLMALCAVAVPGDVARARASGSTAALKEPRFAAVAGPERARGLPVWGQRLIWIALSGVPSSLLLGVTQHITTDIAAVPLLWVVPLTLYLLTFVIAFARRPVIPHKLVVRAQPYVLVLALLVFPLAKSVVWLSFAAHLTLFFVLALACHGELVTRRPAAGRLTEFYFCMAFGGFLGGTFNALIAPVVFDGVYEYGVAIVAAAALRPGAWKGALRSRVLDVLVPLAIFGLVFAAQKASLSAALDGLAGYGHMAILGALALLVFSFKDRPLRFGLGMGAALMAAAALSSVGDIIFQARSFFGVYRVKAADDGSARYLFHGTTLHGAQLLGPGWRLEPGTYYDRAGPLGTLFQVLREGRARMDVGLVGLGVGTALCYARPGDRWTIFEIDPLVVEIAADRRFFSYVDECGTRANVNVLLGDARLRLNNLPDSGLDLLILDAYSSDAVPLHLLTRESLALYRRRLKTGGLLMFHISNRYLELDRALSALLADAAMHGLISRHEPAPEAPAHARRSTWVAAASDGADLAKLEGKDNWAKLPAPGERPWSDDFSNILGFLTWSVRRTP